MTAVGECRAEEFPCVRVWEATPCNFIRRTHTHTCPLARNWTLGGSLRALLHEETEGEGENQSTCSASLALFASPQKQLLFHAPEWITLTLDSKSDIFVFSLSLSGRGENPEGSAQFYEGACRASCKGEVSDESRKGRFKKIREKVKAFANSPVSLGSGDTRNTYVEMTAP